MKSYYSNILYIKGNLSCQNSGSIYTNSSYGVVILGGSASFSNNCPITGADGKLLFIVLGGSLSTQNSETANLVYVPNGTVQLISGGNLANVIGAYGISMYNGGTVSIVGGSGSISSSNYYHYSPPVIIWVVGNWGESL